ncbi:hypothetical protein [uncultured Clostridium sp.]|uniref:hypothetical protein n=1 Tax=uncultured Clostridium sp. TaxID=59620 RepID=UPI00261CCDBF|nr:hypothetical protein [uncultured Clostridium sp.]
MSGIKKDWNYDMTSAFRQVQLLIIGVGIIVIAMKFFVSEDFGGLISRVYANLIMLIIFLCFLYPIFILKNVIPQIGLKKPYMNISNIPLTKKELFIAELKPSIMPITIFVIFGIVINGVLFGKSEIVPAISYVIDAFLISLIIFFQTFIATILCLVKGFGKKKGMFTILGFDLIIALIFIYIEKFFKDPALFLLIAGGTVFILSFIGFIKYWNDIEKTYN